MLEVGGFVLAGGLSSRMGRDKALLEFEGETLVARAVRILQSVCAEVAIAGGDERLAAHGRVIRDERAGCGPLGGMVAALEQTRWEWNVFLAVDMPLVPGPALAELVGAAEDGLAGVMGEADGRVQPLCAVYSRGCVGRLREELVAGRWRVRAAVEAAGPVRYLQLPFGKWFDNVNTPEEFARLGKDERSVSPSTAQKA